MRASKAVCEETRFAFVLREKFFDSERRTSKSVVEEESYCFVEERH